jgi:hypothetical protein
MFYVKFIGIITLKYHVVESIQVEHIVGGNTYTHKSFQ